VDFELANEWVKPELTDDEYRAILGFEMPSEELEYYPVYTIRSSKGRPDYQPKDQPWEWEKLPALGDMNPD